MKIWTKRRLGKKPVISFSSDPKIISLQRINLKITQLRNKYEQVKEAYLRRNGLTNMTLRKKRTRTLIQLGGLVQKSGLLEPLQLKIGDDLQGDELCFDGAATLMGAFSDLARTIQEDETQTMLWRENGKGILAG